MGKRKENIESLNETEEIIEDCFAAPLGKTLVSFSFGSDSISNEPLITEPQQNKMKANNKELEDKSTYNRFNKSTPVKGLTPLIDGESLSIKRSFQFRESTLRKINLLKANHPDINIYLNTVIDAAINHYYEYIFTKGGEQK